MDLIIWVDQLNHILIVDMENSADDEWLNSTLGEDKSETLLKLPIPFCLLYYADLYLNLLDEAIK